MVTKREEPTSTPEPQNQEEGDSLIEDSTAPEVLEKEAAFDAETAQLAEDEGAAEEPEAGAPKGAAEPAAEVEPPAAPEPTPEPVPEVKPERSFSQDEWNKRQSSWDTQQAEITRQVEELRQREVARSLDTEVAARVRVLENQYAPTLGAEEAARVAQGQEPSIREGLLAQEHLRAAQAQLQQSEAQTARQLFTNYIGEVQTKLGLSQDQAARLRTIVTPGSFASQEAFMATGQAIETIAGELSASAKAQRELQQLREAKVPPATPETRLETGDSEVAPDSDNARATRIMETPDWNTLSPEDKAFYRRRVGADYF